MRYVLLFSITLLFLSTKINAQKTYVLVVADVFERIKGLVGDVGYTLGDTYRAQVDSAMKAGWDDPAKTVCDFFCQIAVPVPIRYWGAVSSFAAGLTGAPENTLLRMQMLLPVYQVKWVCIALNHFLAVDGERRRFAKGDGEMQLASQLELAARLMSSIQF